MHRLAMHSDSVAGARDGHVRIEINSDAMAASSPLIALGSPNSI
jgi:hypothetical protein